MAPHLTPVEPLRKLAAHGNEKDYDGVVLVDEELQLLLPDARRIIVEHFAALAVTDAGAESLGRTERHFQKTRHRQHVVLAQTIQPDGKKQPVAKDGVFTQTPQREADAALYDDSAETVIIFPGVKEGCVVEWITVTEETKSRIPGEYTSLYDFAGGWPVRKLVRRAEMPDALAGRMKFTPLGSGVPEMERAATDGNTVFTWTRQNVPGMHREEDRAPLDQTGPCVLLTTLPDWNAFLRWYVPLADHRAMPDEKLRALADEWTKDAKSPREVLNVLGAKVMNDVRYVGLEFSECDLEPHSAAEVWEHQYGDCKDKASLLVALLRHKGITAHMALVNTEHAGRVERRSPDYRHFNHAIAVAMLADGPVFVDATLSGAPPGTLAPSDCDRDVLLVKEPEQWLRTPVQRAGRYGLDFEAALAADGSLSGWATLRTSGYIASIYADYERTGTRDQVRRRLSRQAASRWEGASVVDVKPGVRDEAAGTYELSGYFTVPASGALTLVFPMPAAMLPDPGDPKDRETDYTVWLEDLVTASTITLPEGYTVELPAPVTLDGPFASGRAAWEKTEKGLRAVLEYRPKTARIAAADVAAYAAMLAPLRSWLSKPLTIAVNDKARAAMPAKEDDGLADFPVMPTGDGQLNLVNEKYPDAGNKPLRRRALEKAMTLFPQDRGLQFKAAVQIAWLDIAEDRFDAALRRLKAPLESGRATVDAEEVALAEYCQGLALKGTGHAEEAMAIYTRMAAQADLSEWRRSFAHYQLGLLLESSDPAGALKALSAGIALGAGTEGDLFIVSAKIRLKRKEHKELEDELKAWLAGRPQNAGGAMTELANYALSLSGSEPEQAAALTGVLEKAGDPAAFGKEFTAALEKARASAETSGALAGIAKELKEFLDANAALLPDVKVPEDLKDAEKFHKEMETVSSRDHSGEETTRWCLEFLRRFPPGGKFSSVLRSAAAYENLREAKAGKKSTGPLLEKLLALGDRLPESDRQRHEFGYLRGVVLRRCGKAGEARAHFMAIQADEKTDLDYRATAAVSAADGALADGDVEAALKAWDFFSGHGEYHAAADSFYNAALLELERGHREAAWQWTDKLRALDAQVIKDCPLTEPVTRWLEFTKDKAAAEKWWDYSASWWPDWEKLAKSLGYEPEKGVTAPAIASFKQFGQETAGAIREEKRALAASKIHLVARVARWEPQAATELASLGANRQPFGLDKVSAEYSALVFRLTASPELAPLPQRRLLFTHRMREAMQLKDHAMLLEAAAAFRALPVEPGSVQEVVARYRALAAVALKKEREESAAELEKLLEANAVPDERYRNVWLLSDVYVSLGRPADAEKLLTDAIAHKDIKNNGEAVKALKEQMEKAQAPSEGGDVLLAAYAAWKAVHFPPWLEYARPAKLADFKGDLEESLSTRSELPAHEKFKLATLALEDASQSNEVHGGAIDALTYQLVSFAPDEDTAFRWVEALVEKHPMTARMRATLIGTVVAGAFDQEAYPFIHRLRTHKPWAALFEDPALKRYAPIIEFAALPPGDADAAEAAAKVMLSRPVDLVASLVLPRIAAVLTGAGRVEAARKLAGDVAAAKCDEQFRPRLAVLKLNITKTVTRVEEANPVHNALRAWWLKRQPSPAGPAPKVFVRRGEMYLDDAARLALFDHRVRTGDFDRTDVLLWLDWMRDMPGTRDEQNTQVLEMLRILVAECRTETDRAPAALMGPLTVDLDDAIARKEMLAIIAPWRKLSGAPQTADALRSRDLFLSLRLGQGEPADWLLALKDIKGARTLAIFRVGVVLSIMNREDLDTLKEFLPRLPTTVTLEPKFLAVSLAAWRAADMKEELEAGFEKAREVLPGLIIEAWSTRDVPAARRAMELAAALGQPELIPPAFVTAMRDLLHAPRDRAAFTARAAALRGDWEGVRAAAEPLAAERPTEYTNRFLLGKALVKLGRKVDAVPHLKVYIEFSPNEPEWLEARALLKEAEGK